MIKKMDQESGEQQIREAMEIIKALGMPRQQQNERSALTLLSWNHTNRMTDHFLDIQGICFFLYSEKTSPLKKNACLQSEIVDIVFPKRWVKRSADNFLKQSSL